MKKRELRNGNKIVSALCIIAIVATIICQFVPYWSYTGITQNKEISEERVVAMESSIAGYCWLPNTETSNALEEYIKDPTTFYAEEVEVVEYEEEELAAVKDAVAALEEEAVEEETSEDAEATEETAEETTEATEDAEAAEGEEAAEEATEEEAAAEDDEEKATPADEGEVVNIEGMLVTIKQHKKAAADVTEADKLVKEAYAGLNDNEFVNTLTGMPVLAFVISILCLALAIYKFKKAYIPAIATIIAGVYHWATYFTQPLFQLSSKWGTFMMISLIVAAVGIVMAVADLRTDLKAKKAAKAEAALQESVEA